MLLHPLKKKSPNIEWRQSNSDLQKVKGRKGSCTQYILLIKLITGGTLWQHKMARHLTGGI